MVVKLKKVSGKRKKKNVEGGEVKRSGFTKPTKVPNKKIINKLLEFIDYIAEDGYCNNEEIKDEIRNNYKTLIQKTKTIFYNITK